MKFRKLHFFFTKKKLGEKDVDGSNYNLNSLLAYN